MCVSLLLMLLLIASAVVIVVVHGAYSMAMPMHRTCSRAIDFVLWPLAIEHGVKSYNMFCE